MTTMNKSRFQAMRAKLMLCGWTDMVEYFDFALEFIPRDASVEGGAEKEVRAALEKLGLSVKTVQWLHEDELFEVEFHTIFISRSDLEPSFTVNDLDDDTAWIAPKWEIVK